MTIKGEKNMDFPFTTYDELMSSLDLIIKRQIEEAEKMLQSIQTATCFSCGSPLAIKNRGRKKYCAHCGCYLPEILYDHRFTELVKPMDSVKPPRLGTVYTH